MAPSARRRPRGRRLHRGGRAGDVGVARDLGLRRRPALVGGRRGRLAEGPRRAVPALEVAEDRLGDLHHDRVGALADIDRAAVEALRDELGSGAIAAECDVRDPEALSRLAAIKDLSIDVQDIVERTLQ